MKFKIILKGNERRVIPTGDPPPGTSEKPDPIGLKRLAKLKAPLLKKMAMIGDRERAEITEEVSAEIRPSGKL